MVTKLRLGSPQCPWIRVELIVLRNLYIIQSILYIKAFVVLRVLYIIQNIVVLHNFFLSFEW